jgi:hypothetical protein
MSIQRTKEERLPREVLYKEEDGEGDLHEVEKTYQVHYGRPSFGRSRLGEQITVESEDRKHVKRQGQEKEEFLVT